MFDIEMPCVASENMMRNSFEKFGSNAKGDHRQERIEFS
jgi:hypothetical protein